MESKQQATFPQLTRGSAPVADGFVIIFPRSRRVLLLAKNDLKTGRSPRSRRILLLAKNDLKTGFRPRSRRVFIIIENDLKRGCYIFVE